MTPTSSRRAGSARRVATNLLGVSTGTIGTPADVQLAPEWVGVVDARHRHHRRAQRRGESCSASHRTDSSGASMGRPLCQADPSAARVMWPCQALESTRNTLGRPDRQVVTVGTAPSDGDVVQHRPAGPQQGARRAGAAAPWAVSGLTRKPSSQPTPQPRPRQPGRPRVGRRCWRGCRPGRWRRPRRPAPWGARPRVRRALRRWLH
jgi:hypothetical protein